MKELKAPTVPLTVVAAEKPGAWIVRAMGPFQGINELRGCVERHVGTLDDELRWTFYTYQGWPGYVVYGPVARQSAWPTGVWKFDHNPDTGRYDGPATRLSET